MLKHRYAPALHTHLEHPHVHLVVQAEGRNGRRLRIDKAALREWREDFAHEIRTLCVAANATSRRMRGRNGRVLSENSFQAIRRDRSDAFRAKVEDVARELASTRTVRDPARGPLLATRKALVQSCMDVAAARDAQGEIVIPGDVRYFANHLLPVLTDRQKIGVELMLLLQKSAPKTHEQAQSQSS